jgi:hypothetical protein
VPRQARGGRAQALAVRLNRTMARGEGDEDDAAELGAATMTLYYYVRNKTDIVALMQDTIMEFK